MKTIFHLLKKEWRHGRTWVAVFWLSCLGSTLLEILFPIGFDKNEILALYIFFQALLALVVLVRALHADPVTGTTMFWKTRPIDRKSLFISKVVYLIATLILPFALLSLPHWVYAGFTMHQIGLGILERMLYGAVFVTVFSFAASESEDFQGLIKFCLISALIFMVGFGTMIYVFQEVLRWPYNPYRDENTIVFMVLLMVLTISLLAWMNQMLWGNREASLIIFFIGIFSVLPLDYRFPDDLFKGNDPSNQFLSARLLSDPDLLSRAITRGGSAEAKFRVEGLKEGAIPVLKTFNAHYPTGSGNNHPTLLPIHTHENNSLFRGLKVRYPSNTYWIGDHLAMRQHMNLAANNQSELSDIHVSLPFQSLESLMGSPGVGHIHQVSLDIFEWVQLADLPFKESRYSLKEGRSVDIREIDLFEGGFHINIEQTEPSLLLSPSKVNSPFNVRNVSEYYYVFYHPDQKEGVLWPIQNQFHSHYLFTSQVRTIKSTRTFHYSSLKAQLTGSSIQDWVEGMRIHVYTLNHLGDALATVRNDSAQSGMMDPNNEVENPLSGMARLLAYPIEPDDSGEAKEAFLNTLKIHMPKTWQGRELDMLKSKCVQVFKGDIETLLDAIPFEEQIFYQLMRPVLDRIVTESDIPRLLTALEFHPQLAFLFIRHGWEEKGSVKALELLSQQRQPLPWELLHMAAKFARPEHYTDLEWHVTRMTSHHRTLFQLLKNLPDFPYQRCVEGVWRNHKWNVIHAIDIALEAARFGNLEAFRQAALHLKTIQSETESENWKSSLKEITELEPDFEGQFESWLIRNLGQFRYDESSGKFNLKE